MTSATSLEEMPAALHISSPERVEISALMVAQLGKFSLCVRAWIGSASTAAAILKPACSNPNDSPPAPQKRSMAAGRAPEGAA